ncbi:hypothetical protein YC2023_082677 [Brassica napus]
MVSNAHHLVCAPGKRSTNIYFRLGMMNQRSVETEIRTVNFRLNKETRKTLISQRTRISANYHTSSNQNTRITTIRIRNRKREQSRSYSESAYERLQQGISMGSRAVGEIPSSSNPKTAKPN